jgi:hypothetical protein
MFRSAVSKVMWVGRATVFLVGLAVILALLFGAATMALAGTGVGDTFNLGRLNTVNQISRLVGSTDNAMLRVDNDSGGASSTALDLQVPSNRPPMTVNSSVQVQNLHADWLDGKNSTDFVQPDTNEFFRNSMFEYTSSLSAGTRDSDGTYYIDMPCPSSLKTNPAYAPRLISGGFKDVDSGTAVLESYPTFTAQGEVWRVRIRNNSTLDSFSVVVKCTDQRP